MATNKHAIIRYNSLDQCFSNSGRKYFIDDLMDACNKALYDYGGLTEGIKIRQVYEDIKFMESEQGWSIPLRKIKEGKRVFYKYSDKTFSIKNQIINQSEVEQIKDVLSILSKFKGLPQFDWIEELKIRFEDTFKLKGNLKSVVGFDQNQFLKGLNYFTDLFNAIQNQKPLKVKYKGFKQRELIEINFHPWYLKQYNNRWFLFGLNEKYQNVSNLAIDRIISIKDLNVKYISNTTIDFDEYFDDVIGVTVQPNSKTEKIILKISNEVWPYIESKPLHGSQKIKIKYQDAVVIELNLQVNHEVIATLFSYMDTIEIMDPRELRERFKRISQMINKKYN